MQVSPDTLLVMVADDDDDFRAVIVAALKAQGHSTLEARDGQELLDLLEVAQDGAAEHVPDVVLADVKMPKLSGLGVLEELGRLGLGVPFVAMTGLRDGSISTVALRLGAVEVLRKPFDTDRMLTALRVATGPRAP
jgi:two-component system C4-dicarboxylate transport response regulator DctD